eukprot:3964506-Heterocapsa_arctica.AAC.1
MQDLFSTLFADVLNLLASVHGNPPNTQVAPGTCTCDLDLTSQAVSPFSSKQSANKQGMSGYICKRNSCLRGAFSALKTCYILNSWLKTALNDEANASQTITGQSVPEQTLPSLSGWGASLRPQAFRSASSSFDSRAKKRANNASR